MKRWMISLGVLLASTLGVGAQTMNLTLDQAVEIALSDNPTVKIADMEIQRYDYVKRQAWGNLLPQISASGQYSLSVVKSEMRGGISFGADNTFAFSGDVTLPLFAPQIYRTLKLNKAQLASAVETARATRIDLVAAVKVAFYNILLAEQSLEVLKESEATVQQTVDETQLKYDNGLASEYDLLTAQVQLSNIKPTIIQTEQAIDVAKLSLKMYLSLPEEVEIEVEGELNQMRDMVFEGADLTTDISENSNIKQLDLQVEQLKRQLKVANASRLPTLAAFGQVSFTGNDMEALSFFGAAEPPKYKFFWTNPISVGVSLSVPIFSGLTKSAQSRSIKNQISQLEMQRDYAREQIDVQVRNAISSVLTAREKMFSQETTMKQAEKAYNISETRYNAGAGTMLELNMARLNLTQSRLNFSQAIFDYLSSKADYDKIIGLER
ncbi:MAG: TolC family protein [Rikenellaceae bacterium]|nr:TolC family protein [Rikenellaceae bacterium]